MAEIKKIKVDGVEYDIGSNLGAELEWKLVATGTYYREDNNNNALIYLLEENLEPDKMYYIERYDANMGTILYCFMPTYYDESYEEVQTKGTCLMKAYENDSDTLIDVRVMLSGGTSNKRHLTIISPSNTISLYHDDADYIKVYELTIKNVENPSNVVTPNKLKLYTTGTLDEEIQVGDTEIHYKLEKPLQPNKLYYVERYDANMDVYYNCIIKTDYDALLKCTTKMLASEDDCDTSIFAGIAIIQSGEDDIPNLFYINGGEYSIYKDPEDTLEIYELPFEF